VLIWIALSHSVFALDPKRAISQFVHQSWGPEQGLLGGDIYAIGKSPDGYLWLGTDRGLVRFDGTTFDLIRQPIKDLPPLGRVRRLLTDGQGTLWILLEGGHLLFYRNGQFGDALTSSNLPDSTITAMSFDGHGNLLLSGLGNATQRLHNGRFETIGNSEAVPGTVVSIAETLDGRVWLGTRDEGLFALTDGRAKRVPHEFGDNKVNSLIPDVNGGLWIGTDQGLYFLTVPGKPTDPLPQWTHQHQILEFFRDIDGCVWAGTNDGLMRIRPSGQVDFRGSMGGGAVNAVLEDGEGGLWFGGSGGLERLKAGAFATYSAAEGFPAAPMGPIFVDDDSVLWFAPQTGGLYWFAADKLHSVRQDGLDHDVVYSLDGFGSEVWAGRQSGGLTRIRRAGDELQLKTFRSTEGLAPSSVYAVLAEPSGTVWAGTLSGGVSVFDGKTFHTYNNQNGLGSNTINSITMGPERAIWLATPNGVEEFRKGRWIEILQGDPRLFDVRLCFSDSKGVVWLASTDTLSYLSNGQLTTLQHLPELMREQILGIAEDKLGFFWISTADHVLRVQREALLKDSVGESDLQSYGASDGVFGIEALPRQRSLVADRAGRIWVSLSHGIASADPRITDRDADPVRVRIDTISANGKNSPADLEGRLPAGTQSITFHYSIDSLLDPERARFRYRLEGAEPDWTAAVASRQALYTNLGPGRFRLHVIASRDGVLWNSPETVYALSIDPAFWQTWWFRVACLVAVAVGIAFAVRSRSARLARELTARFQERLSERTRLAQELHDTLLQSFQGLILRFQAVDTLLPGRAAEAKNLLQGALERADTALTESRDAIQGIRGFQSNDSDLASSINGLMAELADEYRDEGRQGLIYSVVVEGTSRELSKWVRSEVLRIAQESARNAFQHSHGSRFEIEIAFKDSHFRIRFRDDGVGIDPEVLRKGEKAGHWGLVGMQERASQIGGQLEVWSRPGAGTEIDLTVPGHIAYDTHTRSAQDSGKEARKRA
jgi:signal transduction histidine kinase/ligand-binding sensor domain-containing protein